MGSPDTDRRVTWVIVAGVLLAALAIVALSRLRCSPSQGPARTAEHSSPPNRGGLPRLWIEADPRQVSPGGHATLTAKTDPEAAASEGTLIWRAMRGTIRGGGHQVEFRAPAKPGPVWVAVRLMLSDRRSVRAFAYLAVGDPTRDGKPNPDNIPPRILSATIDKKAVCKGESTFVRVKAEDPDDKDLQYQIAYFWPSARRTLFSFGRWTRWRAPPFPGSYEILAFVEDGRGGRAEARLQVKVDDCRLEKDQVHPTS